MTLRKLLLCAAVLCGGVALAQPPARPADKPADPPKDAPKDAPKNDLVTQLMAFDKDKDGKLTKDEVTDERLKRLFDRIDTDKKGTITADQIKAFAAKEDQGGGGRGPGGPGGGRGMGMPKPGTVLPEFVVTELKLTDDQKKKLEEIQKEVDKQLDKLLTDDQKKALKEMADRGPGRGPGGEGPGGGGPGGGPGGGRGGPGGRGPVGPG